MNTTLAIFEDTTKWNDNKVTFYVYNGVYYKSFRRVDGGTAKTVYKSEKSILNAIEKMSQNKKYLKIS